MLKLNKFNWLQIGIFLTAFSVVLSIINNITNGLLRFYFPIEYFYIASAFCFLYYFHKPSRKISKLEKNSPRETKNFWKNKNLIFLILAIILSLIFIISNLNKGITVDEHRWINTDENGSVKLVIDTTEQAADVKNLNEAYNRSGNYWDAYLSGDFKSTYNQSNPSAALNFIHILGYLFRNQDFSTYLFFSRLAIVIHNIILTLLLIFFLSKIFSQKQAILAGIFIFISPLFIGFSQIINHDSIQALYIINNIVSLWVALRTNQKKYFVFSGVFYALAVFTQYKSIILMPLLYITPIILTIIKRGKRNYTRRLWNNLFVFFISAIFTTIIILPATLYFPDKIWERLFYYPRIHILIFAALIFSSLLIYYKKSVFNITVEFMLFYEKLFVRATIFTIIMLIIFSFFCLEDSISYIYTLDFYYYWNALLGSVSIVFFSLPEYLLIIMFVWMLYYWIRPKYNLSFFLFSLFWLFIIAATFMTFYWEKGFRTLGTRYIYIYILLLLISLSQVVKFSWFKNLPKKQYYAFCLLIICLATFNNINAYPYYIFDNNIFLNNKYLLTQTTWGTDIVETSNYLNANFKKSIIVYNPRDGLENFTNPNIEVIYWKKRFWEQNPDYIITGWEKNFVYTPILEYYRKNKIPIWKNELNSQTFTAIYKFDPYLDYEKILNTTEHNYMF